MWEVIVGKGGQSNCWKAERLEVEFQFGCKVGGRGCFSYRDVWKEREVRFGRDGDDSIQLTLCAWIFALRLGLPNAYVCIWIDLSTHGAHFFLGVVVSGVFPLEDCSKSAAELIEIVGCCYSGADKGRRKA